MAALRYRLGNRRSPGQPEIINIALFGNSLAVFVAMKQKAGGFLNVHHDCRHEEYATPVSLRPIHFVSASDKFRSSDERRCAAPFARKTPISGTISLLTQREAK
jgi:hypothetical protein